MQPQAVLAAAEADLVTAAIRRRVKWTAFLFLQN
jgi:hypothetical protein